MAAAQALPPSLVRANSLVFRTSGTIGRKIYLQRCLLSRSARPALTSERPLLRVRCSGVKPSSTTTDGPSESEKVPTPSTDESLQPKEAKSEISSETIDSIGAELARLRKEREQASAGPGFLQGVVEETKLIEWPSFSNVVSTTGLVLAVIVSATFAILIVNAILAEISDRIFQIDAVSQLWKL